MIDIKNNLIIPFEYDDISYFSYRKEGWIKAKKNGKWGSIDDNNRIVEPFEDSSESLEPDLEYYYWGY